MREKVKARKSRVQVKIKKKLTERSKEPCGRQNLIEVQW